MDIKTKRKTNSICEICEGGFYSGPKRIRQGYGKYCSSSCYGSAKTGYKPNENQLKALELGHGWNKGMEGMTNEKHPQWKGGDCAYVSLHHWIYRKLGKPTTCVHCKRTGLKGKKIHWANKSGNYKRSLEDWLRLCAKCHWHYDRSEKFKKEVLISICT